MSFPMAGATHCDAIYLSLNCADRQKLGLPLNTIGFLFWPPLKGACIKNGVGEIHLPENALALSLRKTGGTEVFEDLPVCPVNKVKRVVFPDSGSQEGARLSLGCLDALVLELKQDGFPRLASLMHMVHALHAYPDPRTALAAVIEHF